MKITTYDKKHLCVISKVEFNLRDMFTPCRYYELTKLLPGQIFISNINECLKARN